MVAWRICGSHNMTTILSHASSSDAQTEPELWQPFTDHVVHALLACVPFCPDDAPSYAKDHVDVSAEIIIYLPQ